jgi:hypothetical protein
MSLRLPGFCLLAVGLAVAAASAPAADLASYRASYEIKTGTVRSGSPFVAVGGAMAYAAEKTCDGWVISQDMTLAMTVSDGSILQQNFRFSSWESFDGTRYRFAVNSRVDDEIESFRGRAVLSGPKGEGEAVYTEPESMSYTLPAGTLFPMGQAAMIADRAMIGPGHVPHHTFDGTDGEGANNAVIYIGRRIEPAATETDPLLKRPGWLVRLSYFGDDEKALVPEYEVEALQLDNGLAPRMILDYQDFTARLNLIKLEALPEPKC